MVEYTIFCKTFFVDCHTDGYFQQKFNGFYKIWMKF